MKCLQRIETDELKISIAFSNSQIENESIQISCIVTCYLNNLYFLKIPGELKVLSTGLSHIYNQLTTYITV